VDLKWTAAWTVCVIVTREFAVTGLRLAALSAPKTEHTESGEEEKVVAPVISAAILGKIKTFVTMAALGVILFMHIVLTYLTADFISAHSIGRIVEITSDVLIYVSVLFTVLSGVDYFMKYGKFLKQ
jgi:CDP-diacylglycerol--glycerol-3-phosphate 3-phosphatidyltransferase